MRLISPSRPPPLTQYVLRLSAPSSGANWKVISCWYDGITSGWSWVWCGLHSRLLSNWYKGQSMTDCKKTVKIKIYVSLYFWTSYLIVSKSQSVAEWTWLEFRIDVRHTIQCSAIYLLSIIAATMFQYPILADSLRDDEGGAGQRHGPWPLQRHGPG